MSSLLPAVTVGDKNAEFLVIWLHGLGADGHDFEPIVAELNLNIPVRFLFPHAPNLAVTINNGMTMPAWYDIRSPQINTLQDAEGINRSSEQIKNIIQHEVEKGMKTENMILAGFSQGGAIALHTSLGLDVKLAGIMALSTYLPLATEFASNKHSANLGTSIFLAHGIHDPIVPVHLMHETNAILAENGYTTETHQYEMEHSVCQEEVTDISDWINTNFK